MIISTRTTHLGDRYVVTRTVRDGKPWYYSHVFDAKNESRICCHGTYQKNTVDAYFEDVQAAQKDALDGLNPYVTKDYAHDYLTANKRCTESANDSNHAT